MKYSPTFDQVACNDLGYTALDGLLIDLIVTAPVWARKIVRDDQEYFLLVQTKIMEELPSVFGSRQAVTRAVDRIKEVLDIRLHGRSNYYRVKPELARYWGRKEKNEGYRLFIRNLIVSRNRSDIGLCPEVDVNRSDIGRVTPLIGPISGTIIQPLNPLTTTTTTMAGKIGMKVDTESGANRVVVVSSNSSKNKDEAVPKKGQLHSEENRALREGCEITCLETGASGERSGTDNGMGMQSQECSGLVMPQVLAASWPAVVDLIQTLDPDIRQVIVDELAGKVSAGKVRSNIPAYLSGMVGKIKELGFHPSGGVGQQIKPDWQRVPDNDIALVRWARANGYPKAKPGRGYADYRALLLNAVSERMRSEAPV